MRGLCLGGNDENLLWRNGFYHIAYGGICPKHRQQYDFQTVECHPVHLNLTDQLTCPQCGPDFGLILLADRVEARRVYEGRLGCANCRTHYVVNNGVAELVRGEWGGQSGEVAQDPERWAALLGVSGPGMILLLGAFEEIAEGMADLLHDVELIVAHSEIAAGTERAGVSRLRIGDVIPLRNRGMRGVAVANGGAGVLVREAARVCALAARMVVTNITNDVRTLLPELGLRVMAEEGDTLVAVRYA